MTDHPFVSELEFQRDYFLRATAGFTEEEGTFAPAPGIFTVANQMWHAAQIIDWFVEGAWSPTGFDMDFAAYDRHTRAVTSVTAARAAFSAAYARAIAKIGAESFAALKTPIAPGPIMGGEPRLGIISGMCDHTAHHRGALSIYARLLGRTPALPYA